MVVYCRMVEVMADANPNCHSGDRICVMLRAFHMSGVHLVNIDCDFTKDESKGY